MLSHGEEKMVTGLFPDIDSVERVYQSATQNGYGIRDINVIMSDDTRRRSFAEGHDVDRKLRSKIAEGGELGGPLGGTIGIMIPALAAVAAGAAFSALPGLGLVVGGPIAVALASAGTAGVTAGLLGWLSDWGLPKARVREYERGIHDGGILMGVKAHSEDDARLFAQQWQANGARLVHS
ncbi:MAG: hypothetical protein HY308_16640 [Gammaproteobacteria bacterium]|nr:hypothetical protein [Gammaproteobacteria bacterium]